jgi:hypothetical protein
MHVEHYADAADPDLGQQLDRLQPALLDLRAAGQARRREAGVHRPAPHRDGREVPPAHRAAPGTDGALALGLMHELIATAGWTTTTSRAMSTAGRRCASARCSGRPSAPPRSAASRRRGAAAGARLRHTRPAAIRLNYGMQRVHGGGNAVRLIALLPCLTGAWRHRGGGLLLSASGWFRRARDAPRCSGPTCWPAAARARST